MYNIAQEVEQPPTQDSNLIDVNGRHSYAQQPRSHAQQPSPSWIILTLSGHLDSIQHADDNLEFMVMNLNPMPHAEDDVLFVIIPPALWATGGLEAPSFQESFFPEPLFPLGKGFNPFPTLPRGPWTGGFRIARASFGALEPFQKRSKNHSICLLIFKSNFGSMLTPQTAPQSTPKPSQIQKKTILA